MKKAIRLLASVLAAGGLVLSASAAATVEIAAGDTLTVTYFETMTVNDTTIITNSLIKLNEGCTIKIPQSPANANKFFRYQIQLLGDATLDLSEYDDTTTPFRLYSGIYTAAAQAGKKLSVVLPASKTFHIGGSGTFEVYQPSTFLSCMISKDALALPNDTALTFEGCTVLQDFPTNVASVVYKKPSSGYTSIIASGTDVYGTDQKEIVVDGYRLVAGMKSINSNQTIRVKKEYYFKACQLTRSGVSTFSLGGETNFPNNIVLESGSHLWARGGGYISYTGTITGTGTLRTQGYSQRMYLKGELDGKFTFNHGQRSSQIYFRNTAIRQPLNLVDFYTTDNIGQTVTDGYDGNLSFYFQLPGYDSRPTYVPITQLKTTKAIGNKGCRVYTYAKQTIDVEKLSGAYNKSDNGGIIFVDSKKGQGQLNISNIANSVRICLYTNLNVTVTNVASGISPLFDYCCTNAINRTTLAFTQSCTPQTEVRGVAPNVLPRHVRGLAGTLRVGDGTTNPVWEFPFDATRDDPDIAGCEGSGALVVPASGTLQLSFASSTMLPRGRWPLLTGTSGGEALSEEAWPVVYAPGPRPANIQIVRDSTGVWLVADHGTKIIVH